MTRILTIVALLLATPVLSSCSNDLTVVRFAEDDTAKTSVVILNSNGYESFIRHSLLSAGFRVPAFSSVKTVTQKSPDRSETFASSEAEFGIRHFGTLSGNNPCYTNGNSWHFRTYTLELLDLRKNKTILIVSKGGRSEPCPGSLMLLTPNNIFDDLVAELALYFRNQK